MNPPELLEWCRDRGGHSAPSKRTLHHAYNLKGLCWNRDYLRRYIDLGTIVELRDGYSLPGCVQTEATIAGHIARRLAPKPYPPQPTTLPAPSGLNAGQMAAWAILASDSRVVTLTGGPGTGKTYLIIALINAMKKAGQLVTVAAPTGKAASQLGVKGIDARTIHSTLGLRPGEHSPTRFIQSDVLVIDEMSMVDSRLFAAVLEATDEDTRIILVGDPDQIPPVEWGQPFNDMAALVPHAHLTETMRVSGDSGILDFIGAIRNGTVRYPCPGVINFRTAPEFAKELYGDLPRLRKKYPGIEYKDILLLMSLRQAKYKVSTEAWNKELSHKLIPGPRERMKFAVGDRVMFTINNPEHGFVNGELGTILKYGRRESIVIENDYGQEYEIPEGVAGVHLEWAYAMTVHKAQGSEARVVIVPILEEGLRMADRRLLYTAFSRAKQEIILVGDISKLEDPLKYRVTRDTLLGMEGLEAAKHKQSDSVEDFFSKYKGLYQ